MRKRLTALLLCLCMMLTLLPTTAYAAIGNLLGNSRAENQALLEQLEALTGQDGETIQALLEQYGLLDENGNLVTDRTVVLDGVEYTLDEIESLLSDPDTDLSQIGYVDGVPIALGDLKTIIAIERELQRIQETYFSGKVFEGEVLENLNSLMYQLQTTGISMMSGDVQAQSASGGKNPLDVSSFKELLFGLQYGYGLQRSITSGNITLEPGETITLNVTYDPGQVGNCIDRIEVSMGYAAVTLTEDNPTGILTYTCPTDISSYDYTMSMPMRVYLYGKNPNLNPYTHYSYGDLAASLTFSDPNGQVVFQDGSTYSDVHTLLLTTEREAPDLSTSWYKEEDTIRQEDSWGGISFEYYILGNIRDDDGKTQVDRINDLITILQGAKETAINESNAVIYTITGKLFHSNSNGRYMSLNDNRSGLELRPEGDRTVVHSDIPASVTSGEAGEFTYSAWSETGTNAVISSIKVLDPYRLNSGNIENFTWAEHSIKDCTVTLEDDTKNPTLKSVTAPAGTYCPGQAVPITLTFDELVKVADGTAITVNGKEYDAAELHMNTAGNQLVLWYRVLPVDSTGLTVSFGDGADSGVSDIWNNPAEVSGQTVDGVTLVSTQRRNAVAGMEVEVKEDVTARTATVSITLTDESAYKQDILNYIDTNDALPFQAAIYADNVFVTSLPITQQTDAFGNDIYATAPYSIPAEQDAAKWYSAVLQANEGTADSPNWIELTWWNKSFTSAAIYKATYGHITSDTDRISPTTGGIIPHTIDAANPSTWPTLTAHLYTGSNNRPTYTTGKWNYAIQSGDTGASVKFEPVDPGDATIVRAIPQGFTKSAYIQFTFTADNGTPDDLRDDATTAYRGFSVIPGDASYLNFASDTVTAQRYAAFTLNWNSNLGILAEKEGNTIQYTVNLYRGDFTDENVSLEGQTPVATYTVGQKIYSVEFPAGVLSELPAQSGGVAYTVEISAPDPQDGYKPRSARVGIILKTQPVTARLIRPENLYITSDVKSVDIGWELVGLTEGQPATLTIRRVMSDNTSNIIVDMPIDKETGTHTLDLSPYTVSGLKNTYQVTLTVDSGDQAPSTDAFAFHVYGRNSLWLVDEDGNHLTGEVRMDNNSLVWNYYAGSSVSQSAATEEILALRQQLGLLEYIGVNYDRYTWNSFRDGIRWATSNDAIAINYKQGGLYENIKNFDYDTYLPELLMGISATEDGYATVTATHAATGMTASILVNASTLKDKFYLFQVTPAAETTLRYTNGDGAEKAVTTNADGVLALYEPLGIASDVQLSSQTDDGTEYLGTIEQAELLSGEGDAARLQLYPLNAFRLREAAKVELTLVKPDGSPLANSPVTVRGGVFKNGLICESAGLGTSRNSSFDNPGAAQRESGTQFTTDASGKITVYFNASQFTTRRGDAAGLLPSDQIQYVLEISGIANDAYYPLFQTVDGTVSPLKEMRTASGVVVLEAVPAGEANKPFIAQQTVTYSDASWRAGQAMDVRRSTGFVGPNSSFPTAELHTTVLAWGVEAENEYTANQYRLEIVDENGYEPSSGLHSGTTVYPFASIPVVECDLTLSAAVMTETGWVDDGEDIGLKARLSQLEGEEDPVWTLLREITLPFRAVDLTNVTPVDQDKNVTGMLVNMTAASALEEATKAFTDMAGDKAVGKLANGLLNLTGGIDTSIFKMLITPSDDPTVFNALIWGGYNKLELEDVDYSEQGVAVDFFSSEFEVGLPSRDDISEMAQGTYLPVSRSSKHQISLESSGADLKLQLEGFYEAEIRYDRETNEWKVYTKGGGFTAGVGVEFGFDVNAMAGPVPLTASFRVGGAVQLSFQTALRYNQGDDPVNDFLTNLRLNAYVKAFGGIGFDYSIVALKIGLFGELSLDSQNRFLTRKYLENGDLQGQQLYLKGQVGIKFVAECLCISYEAVLASVSYGQGWKYNDWDAIDEYWNGTGTGLSLQSLRYAAAANGLAVTSATATLQSRDYLEQYARTWGEPQARMALFSLDNNNGLENLQTNANPTSFPEISDDGQVLVYISDSNSGSIYDSRAHYSTLNSGSYGTSTAIASPADFTGFGDSDVDVAGTGSFAAAAWVRLSERLTQDAGDEVTLADQNTLMNGAEIVASIYSGGSWTSKRLTNDSAPDLAPAVAANDDKAVVFWRSVVSNAESTGEDKELLEFDARDCLMYSVYNGNDWSEPAMFYNGSNGSVKALQAAMLPDGTAVAVYTLDRSEVDASGSYASYEIGYTIVTARGGLGTTMLATSDTWLDENPQVVTANFGADDNRFVIGWHSHRDGESDIQMLAVDKNGAMSNDFPSSLTALIRYGSAAVNGDFRFASMGQGNGIGDLTVLWSETVDDETTSEGLTVAAHSELKAAKLLRSSGDANYRLSAPLEVAVLPENNLVNHFSAYLSGSDQVKAVIQATAYSNAEEDQKKINGFIVPGEETKLYTATSQFEEYAVEVDAIGVDYENLALNSLTPIQFQIRNTGLRAVSSLKVTVAGTGSDTLTTLQPGESATLTVWHNVGHEVSNTTYTISGGNGISENGTVYLDYPDVGISQMKVLKEEEGKRTIAMTLYNASAATLVGNKERTVKLAFYTDNLLTEAAPVTCATGDVSVSGNTITITGEDNLARIDDGTFTLVLTYDVGSYVTNTLGENEIPGSGVYLYADAWTEGKVGTQTDTQRLPEYHSADNQTAVLLTGAYARTGQETSLNVEQGTDTTGNTTAQVTLTNNCLQQYEGGKLLAVLLNDRGEPLESQIVKNVATKLAGETSDTQDMTFSQAGQRVLVYPILVDEVLHFEGLPITMEDFRFISGTNTWELTYRLRDTDSAPNLLITAYSQDGVQIDGEDLVSGGAKAVGLQELKMEGAKRRTIEMQVGDKHYTLTLLPQDDGAVYPQKPNITTPPQDAAYLVGDAARPLTVEASVTDGGALSYQWYSCNEQGYDRKSIPNATGTSYTPPTDAPGTYYYFCGVTNTLPDGQSEATAYSRIVKIVVTEGTALTEVTITFNANGGECSVASAVTENGKLTALPTPTREGHTFNGWFTASTGGEEVTTDTVFTSDTTLYARWTENGEEPDGPDHGGASSGVGGGGASSYQITVEDSSNGEVTTNRKTASAGSTITLTVTPDDGYVLDTLTVTDSRGNELKLTDKGSGKYTFTMSASSVTITASFMEIAENLCDGGENCPSRAFTDLSTTAWYHEAVDFVLVGGIMGGYGGGLFGPDDSLSRAQLCQILYNREGKPTVTGSSPFTDVADTAWYADAVIWANSKGIVGGYGGGLFGPNDPITREQLAAILWRYAGSPASDHTLTGYTDVDQINSWAMEAMLWVNENGILNGDGNGHLIPKGNATRAHVAQMIKNFIKNLEKHT
ncbi:MAG: S-layer homology domain-containing protein [Oscillospiraceae bacterium]|nr:S-layer homology domain-containing protein [Oscillospiraceae bacterium]